MATARRRRGRPGEERVAVRDLRPGAAAGRGLRLPSGATVALGTPLSGDQVEVLRSVAPQATVPILTRGAVGAVALGPKAVAARAEILQGALRANLPPWPAAGRAVRPQVGEDAAVALELAASGRAERVDLARIGDCGAPCPAAAQKPGEWPESGCAGELRRVAPASAG